MKSQNLLSLSRPSFGMAASSAGSFTSPGDGTLRQYWLLIQSAASKVRIEEELLAAGGAGLLTGGGAAVGTLMFTGIGTLIVGGIGLIAAAVNAVAAAKKRKQRRYSLVLSFCTKWPKICCVLVEV